MVNPLWTSTYYEPLLVFFSLLQNFISWEYDQPKMMSYSGSTSDMSQDLFMGDMGQARSPHLFWKWEKVLLR